MAKPTIRFKGYTEDWEQRKLGWLVKNKIIEAPKDGNHGEKHPTADEYVSEGIPFLMASDIRNGKAELEHCKHITKERAEMLDKGFAKEGDVLLTHKATIGEVAILKGLRDEYAMLTPQVTYYRIHDNTRLAQRYLYAVFNSNSFQNEMQTKATQSTRPYIGISEQQNLTIAIPCSIEEQKKVGKYFSDLDHLITLHHRKCEETKILKKYMLQKMFPQNGQKVPEIRFKGFTEDWEQRKFADFTWDAGKRNKEDLDLEPYAITNEHGFIRQRDAHDDFGYMKDTDRKAYNIVQPNSFAYNPARINVGSIGYYKGVENVIVSSLYEVFQTDNYVNDRFLWHWLKSDEFPRWIEKLQEGSVRLYFYYDKLCECQLYMPSLEEQEKIASFLDDLDHLITLHQRKCEELKNIKKFMLQNMFV